MENQEDILLEFGINIQSFQKDVKKIETVLKQFQASNSLFDLKVVTSQFKAFEKYILNLNKNMLVAMHKDMGKSDKSAQKTIYDSRIKQAKDANKKIVDNEKESRETELKNLKEAILSRNNEQINSLNYNNKQSEKYIKKQLSDEQKLRDQHSAFIKRLELKLAGELKPAQQKLLQDFIAKSKARVVNNKQDLHQLKLDYATALKAISTSTSATGKQVDAEFKKMARSWRGVFSDETGTTFMHKFFTTAQYATAGAGLYGIQGAFASIKDSIFEADKALTSFKAILDMNDTDAKELKDTVYKLGTTYGGNIQTYNESALALGRAGLSGKELSDSLKVVSQMALISGSSMDDVTEMLVTWSTVYKDSGDTVEQLGDKITAAANASLASIDGFKTMTSYVLSAGETAGMTSDALISFLASMKQIGKADSIVGTETRRLMNQLSSGSNDVREAYWKMGIDIKKVYEGVAQGGKEGEAVFREFMTNLSKVSDKTSQESIKNIKEVLDRQTIISTTAAAKQYEIQELAVKNATGSSERASKLMATTYEQATERIINKAKELSVIFGDNFTKSMFDEATVKDFELALNEATNVFKGFVSIIGSGLGSLASYLKYLDDIVVAYVAYKTVNLAIGKLGNLFSVDKIAEFSAKLIGMESSILKAKSAITGSGGLNAGLLDLATTGRAISFIFKSWPELITAAIVAMYSAYQEHLALEAKLKKQIQDYKDEQKKSEEEYSKFLNTNNGKLMSMYNTIEAYNKILANGNISEAQKNIILKQRATLQKQYNDLLSNVTKESNIDIGAKGEFKTDTKVKTASQIANYEKDISDEKAKQVELQEELDGKFKTTVEKAQMQYDIAKKELKNAEKSKASDTYTLDVEKAKTKVKEAQLKLQQAEVNEKYKNKLLEIENKELQYTALASANDMLDAYRKLVTNKQLVALYQKENNSAEVIALSNNVKKTELQLEQAKALGDNVAIQEKESALTQAQIALDNKRKDIAKGITSNYLDATNAIKNMGEQLSKDIAKEQNLGDTFKDGSAEIEDWYATAKQNIEQMIEKYKDLYNQSSPEIEKLYDDLAKLKNIKLDDLTLKVRIEGIDNAISTLEATRNEYNGFYIDLEKAQLEYAKEYLSANGDIKKEKIAEAKFDKKNSDIKKDQLKSEIDAYSNLAGAIGGALEDGSKAQAAFMLTSQMLSMYNAVQAVIQAWASAPFPANLPAVATTTAAVIPLLSQIGATLTGGSGGASEVPAAATQEQIIEAQYNPMLDRLDMQIELLQAIEKNGSAQAVGVESARLTYERDMQLLVADLTTGGVYERIQTHLDPRYTHDKTTTLQQRIAGLSDTVHAINAEFGAVVWTFNGLTATLNQSMVNSTDELIRYFAALKEVGAEHLMVYGSTQDSFEYVVSKANENIGKIQEVIGEYALSMTDIIAELSDAKDDFEEIFDDITGTTKYATLELEKAFDSINELTTIETLPEYLDEQISAINEIEELLSKSVVSLLLSKDTADFAEQVEVLSLLNERLGTTYQMGTEDAINFIESLRLVSDALVTSRENIKSFTDSFKDEQQLAEDMASSLGVSLATTTDGLQSLFDDLSGGIEGLSDAELDLLTANKALIESEKELAETRINSIKDYISGLYSDDENLALLSNKFGINTATSVDELATMFERLAYDADGLTTEEIKLLDLNKAKLANTEALQTEVDSLNESLSKTSESISSMESVFESLQDTIKELRASGQEPSKTLSDFMNSIVEAKDLLAEDDYEAYADKISDIIGGVSILDNTSLFGSKYDMEFAKARTAIELESLEDLTMDEVDYLKQIEENTRAQVDVLVESMNSLGQSINSSLAGKITSSPSYLAATRDNSTSQDNSTSNLSMVMDAYSQLDLHKYQTDDSGYNYWENQLTSGALSSNQLMSTIASSAVQHSATSNEDRVAIIYKKYGLDQYQTDDSGYNYWENQLATGALTPNNIEETIKTAAEVYLGRTVLPAFATGGYTGNLPTDAMAGIVHGQEYVINAQTTKDLGLNNQSNVFSELLEEVRVLRQDNQAMKSLMIKLTADNSKMLTIDRAIYASTVA